MRFRIESPGDVRIEMFPLIDSFFLILVYFVYTFLSLSMHQGIELNLPQGSSAVERQESHHGVSVTKDGELYFDKEPVSIETLSRRLHEAKSASSEAVFYIYGDKSAPHGVVVSVLDIFRKISIDKVFIQTDPYGENSG